MQAKPLGVKPSGEATIRFSTSRGGEDAKASHEPGDP